MTDADRKANPIDTAPFTLGLQLSVPGCLDTADSPELTCLGVGDVDGRRIGIFGSIKFAILVVLEESTFDSVEDEALVERVMDDFFADVATTVTERIDAEARTNLAHRLQVIAALEELRERGRIERTIDPVSGEYSWKATSD